MKLGYITDLHTRAETPEGRTDNFNKSLLLKLEEAGQIFKEKKVDVILCGGDWCDRPDVVNSVVYDLIGILKDWKKPIYGIIGSHDYYGYEIKSLKRTAVGIIDKAGIIELIGSSGMPEYLNIGNNIVLCGTPHTFWLDNAAENFYKPKYIENTIQIQLTHGTLLEAPAPFPHVLLKEVNTESNLVLGAHYHPGWKKIHHIKDTYFMHPGSIARLDNTGVERIPQVSIIDINESGKVSFEFVKLLSAISHPFKEKFKESKEDISMNLITKVMDLIQNTQVNVIDVKQQIPKVAKELGYDKEIIDEAFLFIEDAEKEKK